MAPIPSSDLIGRAQARKNRPRPWLQQQPTSTSTATGARAQPCKDSKTSTLSSSTTTATGARAQPCKVLKTFEIKRQASGQSTTSTASTATVSTSSTISATIAAPGVRAQPCAVRKTSTAQLKGALKNPTVMFPFTEQIQESAQTITATGARAQQCNVSKTSKIGKSRKQTPTDNQPIGKADKAKLFVKRTAKKLANVITCGRVGSQAPTGRQELPTSGPAAAHQLGSKEAVRVPMRSTSIRFGKTDETRRFKKKEPPGTFRGSTKTGPLKTPRPHRPVPIRKSPIREVAINMSDTALAFAKLRELKPLPEQVAPLAPF